MATLSINATKERPGTLSGRQSVVPWLTVVPLAVLMAYAGGFWMIAFRGAVGSIDRTRQPFATWLLESTLVLPIFVLAVIGALALAARWFGPVLRKPKTVVATALLIVAAGTLVSIALLAASSGYDLHLQAAHLTDPMGSMDSKASAISQQAGLWVQVKSVAYGSGLILVTNLLLVGWVVALRGGGLSVRKTRR